MLYTQTVSAPLLELLRKLLTIQELSEFALVGGTNLSLRLGHRRSIDIDLFTNKQFDSNELLPNLGKIFPDINIISQKSTSLTAFVNEIKIDIVLHEYPYIRDIELQDDIRLASVPDIIAMKLNAIAQRGARKDFWDIATLLDQYTIAEMLGFYKEKYTTNDIYFVIRSLTYFDDADNKQFEKIIALNDTTWETVKNKVNRAVKKYINAAI